MKYDNIKTLKVLEFDTLCYLMLMVLSKNLLHIDTPEHNTRLKIDHDISFFQIEGCHFFAENV